jgi:hypothetical protein
VHSESKVKNCLSSASITQRFRNPQALCSFAARSLPFLAVVGAGILIQSFLDPQESDTKLRKKWHTDPTTGVLGKYCQVGFTYILEKSLTGFTFDGWAGRKRLVRRRRRRQQEKEFLLHTVRNITIPSGVCGKIILCGPGPRHQVTPYASLA